MPLNWHYGLAHEGLFVYEDGKTFGVAGVPGADPHRRFLDLVKADDPDALEIQEWLVTQRLTNDRR